MPSPLSHLFAVAAASMVEFFICGWALHYGLQHCSNDISLWSTGTSAYFKDWLGYKHCPRPNLEQKAT